MKKQYSTRPFYAGVATFTAATTFTSAIAMAACGGAPTLVALGGLIGPPSITATEASTEQALELVRKRRDEAAGVCPIGFTRSGGNCVQPGSLQVASAVPSSAPAAPSVAAPPAAQASAPASQAAPAQKRVVRASPRPQQAASPAPAYSAPTYAPSSYDAPAPGIITAHGAWVEGYVDRERHTNLNPNQQANPTRKQMSGGVISGVDWSRLSVSSNTEGFQLGFFSGYNNTRSKFTDTIGTKPQNNNSLQTVATTDSRQDIDGAFLGLYGSYILNRFSMDLAFKIDLFDMNQQRTEQVIGCGAQAPVTTIANTAMTNYTVASNANYRFDLASNLWLEPTVGVRYTKTDFGSNATALGVTDGDAFRVQGGLRLGTSHYRPNGWRLSHSITGLLYSDVAIDGYVVPSTVIGYTTPLVDEGKLRVMGILETKLDIGGGMTFYGDVEARGGKDVVGLGGRLGVRYQW